MAKAKPNTPLPFKKSIEKIAAQTHHRHGDVFRSFCRLAACALSCGQREEEYLQEVKQWQEPVLSDFCHALGALILEMERRPFADVLGELYMEWCGAVTNSGEFYTPQAVCRATARMTFDPSLVPTDRPIEVQEPCCGSGSLVLAFAETLVENGLSPLRMRAQCIDISRCACDMCFINLTLWGVPAEIVHGDALKLEAWASWRNPFYGMAKGADDLASTLLRLIRCDDELPPAEPVTPAKVIAGQFVFDWEESA